MINFGIKSSKAIRALLKKNLNEEYDEKSILKELIQNANDAGAKNFHFIYLAGLTKTSNILLQQPSIIFINDGEFTKSNMYAISNIFDDEKLQNYNKIGKFGLGLKSIFHWCESFFYFSSGFTDASSLNNQENQYFQLLNPWSLTERDKLFNEKSYFDEWQDPTIEDYLLIKKELNFILANFKNWFIIWAPLRSKKLMKDIKNPLKNNFPADDKNFANSFENEQIKTNLISILPLMTNLKKISYWINNRKIYEFENTQENLPIINENKLNEEKNIIGYIGESIYWRYYFITDTEKGNSIKDKQYWPYIETEEGSIIKEKAFEQGAVVIILSEAENPKKASFNIDWNVYLPLSDMQFSKTFEGKYNIHIIFHGYFFTDSGRKEIKFNEDTDPDKKIRAEWNKHIAQDITLPLLIPTIEEILKEKKDYTEVVDIIVEKLYEYKKENTKIKDLNFNFIESICEKKQLIKKVYPENEKWEVIGNKVSYYIIPDFNLEKVKDNEIIKELLQNNIFIKKNSKSLAKNSASWTKDMLLKLFEIDIDNLIENKDLKNLWLEIIKQYKDSIQAELIKYIKSNLEKLLKQKEEFYNQFFDLVSKENKIYLNLSAKTYNKYLTKLNVDIEALILLTEKDKNNENNISLTIKQAEIILNNLKNFGIENNEYFSEIAISVINTTENKEKIKESIKNLPLFNATLKGKTNKLVSYSELLKTQENSLLFLEGKFNSFLDIIDDDFKIIKKDIAVLLSLKKIKCNAENILNVIYKKQARLNTEKINEDFIKEIGKLDIDESKKAVRYLLHQEQDKIDNLNDKLFYLKDDYEKHWAKFLEIILKNQSKGWTFLDKENISFIKYFSSTQLDALNVKEINKHSVKEYITNFIENDKLAKMDFRSISIDEKERKEVIDKIIREFDDFELLKKFPIFESLSGKLVPITRNTYLSVKIHVPDEIWDKVTLLKPNNLLEEKKVAKIKYKDLIRLFFENTTPANHREKILFMLEKIEKTNDLEEDVIKKIKEEEWIPLKNSAKFCGLNKVVYLENLNEIIKEITNKSDNYYCIEDLDDSVSKEQTWNKLKKLRLINSESENLDIISEILLEDTNNFFGAFEDEPNDEELNTFLEIFDTKTDIFPIIGIISKIKEKVMEDNFYNFFRRFFTGTLNKERFISVFKHLEEISKNSKKYIINKNDIYWIFLSQYLKLLNKHSKAQDILSKINLLNENDEWWSTDKLCYPLKDIDSQYQLSKIVADNIMDIIIKTNNINQTKNNIYYENEVSNEFYKLKKYFEAYIDYTNIREAVGMFFSIIGDKPEYIELSNLFLTNEKDYLSVRKKLKWSVGAYYGFKFDPDLINSFFRKKENWINLEVEEFNEEIKIVSITGEIFYISMSEIPLNGKLHRSIIGKNNKFFLKPISYNKYSKQQLIDALYGTIVYIIEEIYQKKNTNIQDLWEKYTQPDQITLKELQRLIEDEEIIKHLRNIKFENEIIKEIFKIHDEIRQFESILYEKHFESETRKIIESNKKKKLELRTKVKELFNNDEYVNFLISSLKKNITDFQYNEESVIFELFQNADDAVGELKEMGIEPEKDYFKIKLEPKHLYLMHWGRKINQDRGGKFTVEDGRKRRYNDDVLKMLTIGYSKKTDKQTGKYGLGFKSIYFLTDEPKILSGMLGFKIKGGIYPEALEKKEKETLREKIYNSYNGTIFDIDVDNMEKVKNLVAKVENFAYIQTFFSKSIRKIIVNNNEYSNDLTDFMGLKNIHKVKTSKENYALLFKFGDIGDIALNLGKKGFKEFDNDIPKIWVTVPTKEKTKKIKFLINAQFKIDVGRTQLAVNENPDNLELAEKLGNQLYEYLERLYQADFEELKKHLGISAETTKYEFWESLFKIFKKLINIENDTENKADEIAKIIVWGENNGYLKFITESEALPNDLPEPNKQLVALKNVENIIKTDSLFNEDVIKGFFDNFKDNFKNLKNNTILYKQLKNNYIENKKEWDLKKFLEHIIKNKLVSSDIANKLGIFLYKKDNLDSENNGLINYLENLKFLTKNNTTNTANNILLNNNNDDDEALIAAFAPDENLLSDEYGKTGIKFFLFCRKKEFSFNYTMANWALKAETEKKQIAVLKYLLLGNKYRLELADFLNIKNSNWLDKLKREGINSPLLNNIDIDNIKKNVVLALLGFKVDNDNSQNSNHSDYDKSICVNWDNLHNFWKNNKESIITKYEKNTYPKFFKKELLTDDYENSNVRKQWMIMFLLGISHTFGFDDKNTAKNFINHLEERGLIEFMANFENDKKSEEWFYKFVDPIFDEEYSDEQYRNWMNRLTSIYKISKYLSDYIQRFLDALKFKTQNIALLLKPRNDSDSYIDIPPINRTLNMGANFILRELVRFKKGNIENKEVFKYCFVPKKQIRDFIEQSNLISKIQQKINFILNSFDNYEKIDFTYSKIIYDSIKRNIPSNFDITFNYCFDIALSAYIN